MNTANLQLVGLNLVIALHEALIAKDAVSRDEPSTALRRADRTAIGDYRSEELIPAHRDAVASASRVLTPASAMPADGVAPPFSELAKMVGQTKEPYNDQR